MDYLAKVTIDGDLYEAHVSVKVQDYDGELDAEFSTVLGYVNDVVCDLYTEFTTTIQEELIDDAIEQWRSDNNADAVYDAMRDGCWR